MYHEWKTSVKIIYRHALQLYYNEIDNHICCLRMFNRFWVYKTIDEQSMSNIAQTGGLSQANLTSSWFQYTVHISSYTIEMSLLNHSKWITK